MSTPAGQHDSAAGQVRLRYWAAARSAAGVAEDLVEVPGRVTLADLEARAKELHASSPRFAGVLAVCSVLVGDLPVGAAEPGAVLVEPGQTVEFLPPFAGG